MPKSITDPTYVGSKAYVNYIKVLKKKYSMSIDVTRSEGNTDKMYGYLEGHADGMKHGMGIMKTKACREFSKILGDIICPEMVVTEDDIKEMEQVFLKRLEE